MKKIVGLFVLVMLATAVGVFAAMVLYNGMPEGWFAAAEPELDEESKRFDEYFRSLGAQIKRPSLPRNWQKIVETQALPHFKEPEKIRFFFADLLVPLPEVLYDCNPRPVILYGWSGLVGVEEKIGPGKYTDQQVYKYFIDDDKLIFFGTFEEVREMLSAEEQKFRSCLFGH